MKKILIATLFALVSAAPAFADSFASMSYRFEDPVGGAANRQGYQVNFGTDVVKGLKADVFSESLFTDGNGANQTRLELGLTPSVDFNYGITAYARVAAGEKFIPGDKFAYYSVEPGVKYAVSPALAVKVGYRFRDAFDPTANADLTRTWKLGAEYSVSKTQAVIFGIDRARGDSDYTGANVGYLVRF